MAKWIKKFNEIHIGDVPLVGGKNASLGEMLTTLSDKGIGVPDGFASTADAFWYFLGSNELAAPLKQLLDGLDRVAFTNLAETGRKARQLLLSASLPADLSAEIVQSYHTLCGSEALAVAVRSSATAEDLPNASFAGQHESYLNIKGDKDLLDAVRRCFASLYTDRAIKYREDKGFAHTGIALSVGIQLMVRSDLGCSGIGFTLEPESGFRDVVHLSGVWGLGENIVQGAVIPDEFFVFKPTLLQGKKAILQKRLGSKEKTMVYAPAGSDEHVQNIATPPDRQAQFVLSDREITTLALWAQTIETHYGKPMDIEWAKDGATGQLYIIQARPETVHTKYDPNHIDEYSIIGKPVAIASGEAVGTKVAAGVARVLQSPKEIGRLREGEIVVTDITSPDWDPVLKKAVAIVTNKGGRTSHASIVARELGVPAIVGTTDATEVIKDGEWITVSCCEGKKGFVYRGPVEYRHRQLDTGKLGMPETTEAMMILGDPDKAFKLSFYPNDGIGLMRLEFIITHFIQIHPMALVHYDTLKDAAARERIGALTRGYPDKQQYFIDRLAQGVATIAAAFYPKDVIVRMSDFKTNEYANLIGGSEFEPKEENPMMGFRGASRYYSPLYKPGFRLECEAMRVVREEMGLTNVKLMIPFCRTVEEGMKVIDVMQAFGLDRHRDDSLEIYVMAEIPSNVLLAEEFAALFDGFSIGSNDLTQLTLGIDRDSTLVAELFSEQNKAAELMIGMMIEKAKLAGVKIGLCGQAPSDFPEFAQFLVSKGIDSISFNADALLQGIENIKKAEKERSLSFHY